MNRRTLLMIILTVLAAIAWGLHFVPGVGMPANLSDFFGGAAVGFGIGAAIDWIAERL